MTKLEQLINKHGQKGIMFEQSIYRIAEHFSPEYNGGYWESMQVVDDESGFYLKLDDDTSYSIRNTQNGYDKGDMDSLTFGLAIFSFACNYVGNLAYEDGDEDFADDLFKLQYFCQAHALRILGDEKRHAQYHWFLD